MTGYSLLVKLKNLEKSDATTGWLSSGLNGANSVSFDGEFMFLFILTTTISLYAFWNPVNSSLWYLRSPNHLPNPRQSYCSVADIDATYVCIRQHDSLTHYRWSRSLRPLWFVLEILRCFKILIDDATDIKKVARFSHPFCFFFSFSPSMIWTCSNRFKEERAKCAIKDIVIRYIRINYTLSLKLKFL